MTERSCDICVKRHETGNVGAPLECRALPPIQGLARDAGYPVVTPAHYCHSDFQRDEVAFAARARARARSEAARLDGLAAATAAAAPLVGEAGQTVTVPQGDLLADIAAPRAIAPKAKRARRARPAADE